MNCLSCGRGLADLTAEESIGGHPQLPYKPSVLSVAQMAGGSPGSIAHSSASPGESSFEGGVEPPCRPLDVKCGQLCPRVMRELYC